MANSVPTERRVDPRRNGGFAAQLFHGDSGRYFPCRSVDLSDSGAQFFVPATMPVRVGHVVRLDLAAEAWEIAAELMGRDLDATVVRVDREALLTTGHISIGITFDSHI